MNNRKHNNQAKVSHGIPKHLPSHATDVNVQYLHQEGKLKPKGREKLKYFDAAATITPATTGTLVDLFAPAQGVSIVQRAGDTCSIRGMYYCLDSVQTTLITSTLTRIIFLQWHDSGVPGINDILQSITYNSFPESNQPHTYTILKQVKFTQSGLLATSATASTFVSDWGTIERTSGFQDYVQFTAGATVGVEKIYMLVISNTASASSLTYNTRIVFADT